jgi:hypothetical protein
MANKAMTLSEQVAWLEADRDELLRAVDRFVGWANTELNDRNPDMDGLRERIEGLERLLESHEMHGAAVRHELREALRRGARDKELAEEGCHPPVLPRIPMRGG